MNYLSCEKYRELCSRAFDPKDPEPPESGIIFVHMESFGEFIEVCNKTNNKYVAVTAKTDYGLAYQSEHPVWKDMRKWVESLLHMDESVIDFREFNSRSLVIPPRCVVENCSPDDRYSIKCDSHTHMTFDYIPANVHHWFMSNSMVEHPKITCLPFGMHPGVENILANVDANNDKDKWVYVNFQTYTLDRFFIKGYLSSRKDDFKDWMTFAEQANKPLEHYLQDISEHKFTLCPNGNGVDCYRTWEALYLGSIPIVERSATSGFFRDLPIVEIDDIGQLNMEFLQEKYAEIKSRNDWNYEKLDLNFWKTRIEEIENEVNY